MSSSVSWRKSGTSLNVSVCRVIRAVSRPSAWREPQRLPLLVEMPGDLLADRIGPLFEHDRQFTDISKRPLALLKDAGVPSLHFVQLVAAGFLLGGAAHGQRVQLGGLGLDLLRERLLAPRIAADAVEDRAAITVDHLQHPREQQ